MSRFDQCTESCTSDCGHCKGRPVAALLQELQRVRIKRVRDAEIIEAARAWRWADGARTPELKVWLIEAIDRAYPGQHGSWTSGGGS